MNQLLILNPLQTASFPRLMSRLKSIALSPPSNSAFSHLATAATWKRSPTPSNPNTSTPKSNC
ncbi:MAG: hypothetical protein MUF49_25220 [Oculatellaceae cyanobacterium Prado106]|nr:hypothetical protein [Oculatellaceae cyanobacterium Prado106]